VPDGELYDLQADPFETNNLAASSKPEPKAVLRRLCVALEKWIVDTDDQGRFPETVASGDVPPKQRKQKPTRNEE
jgi:hypothetical protein